jgi:hypothetical protein
MVLCFLFLLSVQFFVLYTDSFYVYAYLLLYLCIKSTVLTLRIGTIFIDELPAFYVLKKNVYYAGIKIFNSLS